MVPTISIEDGLQHAETLCLPAIACLRASIL